MLFYIWTFLSVMYCSHYRNQWRSYYSPKSSFTYHSSQPHLNWKLPRWYENQWTNLKRTLTLYERQIKTIIEIIIIITISSVKVAKQFACTPTVVFTFVSYKLLSRFFTFTISLFYSRETKEPTEESNIFAGFSDMLLELQLSET